MAGRDIITAWGWREHNPVKMPRIPLEEKLEFIARIIKTCRPDECIHWPFGQNKDGYSKQISIDGNKHITHRYILSVYTGVPYDNPLQAAHGPCHNRNCVNPHPGHGMAWKREVENQMDRVRDGTDTRGERSGRAKLSNDQAIAIYNDPRKPRRIIAQDFGVSVNVVYNIKSGTYWSSITGHK